ncbi:MAG TPA: hypothetical protein DDZ39_12185 [Flavobacteriaceae bacterium]|jgi:hypothetical protein|nr:hypothetical protein [Flavobacteriaceae bacterium]HBS13269.1 hypothetical protein [Flavobacteriaceae bacterium]
MKLNFLQLLTILFLIGCGNKIQTQNLEKRSVEYYFEEIGKMEIQELLKKGILKDSLNIAEKYRNNEKNELNEEGFNKYTEIKIEVYQSLFKDYLYQEHIEFENSVYVLYFTVAGFDDTEWDVVKWDKDEWNMNKSYRLNRNEIKNNKLITKIFWNYDEGPKNLENIRLFVKNDYLILERGNLYHSLYDLKSEKLIINEESPWHEFNGKGKEEMNKWIKENLHDKIEIKINGKRE